ncbi:unnamed protein product, partial [marine sediment metagenome]
MDYQAHKEVCERTKLTREALVNCNLCPRQCGVDRTVGEKGDCGLDDTVRCFREMLYCGQKISVTEVHAGKKGKCPKCKTIVVVPEINNNISLKPQDNDTDNLQYVQQPPEPELRLKRDTPPQTRFDGLSADGLNVTNKSLLKPEIKEKPPERKLPWILN